MPHNSLADIVKLPPKLAPIQTVIVPIASHKEGVIEKATEIYEKLKQKYRVKLDTRDQYSTGYKFNDWEMRGVPVRIELGPRDIEQGKAVLVRRDTGEKVEVSLEQMEAKLGELLEQIQENMYQQVLKRTKEKTTIAKNMDEFIKNMEENQGYVKTMWCGKESCEDKIKELTGAHSRCIPFEQEDLGDTCVCCGEKAKHMVIWGRQY